MTEPEINVEAAILNGLANQMSRDLDWALMTVYWEWNENIPMWLRWVCNNRIFFWFANRYKMGWFGQWVIPPFPDYEGEV